MVPAGYKVETAASGPEAQRQLATAGSVAVPLPTAGLTLRYAFVSQRGYYPDAPDKSNQDAVCVAERLGGGAGAHGRGAQAGGSCAATWPNRSSAAKGAPAASHHPRNHTLYSALIGLYSRDAPVWSV
mgnify:CR=1 FL=1